jgi:hypothetical protein
MVAILSTQRPVFGSVDRLWETLGLTCLLHWIPPFNLLVAFAVKLDVGWIPGIGLRLSSFPDYGEWMGTRRSNRCGVVRSSRRASVFP